MRKIGLWGSLGLIATMMIGCMATPIARSSKSLWDLNYSSRTGAVLEPKPVEPIFRTEPVPNRTGSVAIWTHPTDPKKSLVIGTDASRSGGLYVYNIRGKQIQRIPNVRLAYGMQIKSGFKFGPRTIDIAVTIERDRNRLRIFGINPTKQRLWDITGETKILTRESGPDAGAMALALYRDPAGRTLAVVSRKSNFDEAGILFVYELRAAEGQVNAVLIRDLGEFSRRGIVSSVLADDFTGRVFYFDQEAGIRKYALFPKSPEESRELFRFADNGWERYCAGLAIYPGPKPGSGYILAADRQNHRTTLHFFSREGEIDRPEQHRTLAMRATLASGNMSGMDVSSQPIPKFPEGMFVVGNQQTMTYDFFSWRDIRTQQSNRRTSP